MAHPLKSASSDLQPHNELQIEFLEERTEQGWVMRRQLGNVLFAGMMALIASPAYADRTKETDAAVASAPVAVQRVNALATGLRDEAAMVLVGTALIGLAAAVRRAA